MRVFVAIELSPTSREAVCRFVSSLLRRHTALSATSGTWVAASNLHVTLRFLGDLPASRLAQVGTVVETPFREPGFCVSVDRCGSFPTRGVLRVIWLGVGEGQPQLVALHNEVVGRLEECGYPAADRPFRPHVTIGRVKRVGQADATHIRVVLDTVPLAVPRWTVGRVVLYESRLSTRGSTYHVLTSGPLSSRSG